MTVADMIPQVSLSIITKPSGILTKKLSVQQGRVISDSSECRISSAVANRITLPFDQVPQLLKELGNNQCCATGWANTDHTQVELMSRDKFESKHYQFPVQELPHGVYATRTLDSFTQKGQSLIMFDYDDDEACPYKINCPEQFIELLSQVIPDFNKTTYIRTFSTSSGVYDRTTGVCLKEAAGFHLWMVVPDGSDIQRFGEVLEKRLWLAGLGYIKVSTKNANLNIRTVIDTAVFSPERLVFEAGAVISDESIEQRLPSPEYNAKQYNLLDTKRLPNLSDLEEKSYQTAILNAKLADHVVKTKNEIKQRIADDFVVKAQMAGRIIPRSQAMRMVENLERHILPPFHIIYFADGSQATVMDIVANPMAFDGRECLDPIREDKGHGRSKIFANLDQAVPKPQIHSFVEGGRNFDLMASMKLLHVKTVDEEFTALRDLVTTYQSQDSEYFKAIELKPGINLIKGEKGTGKTFTIAETIRATELSVLGITPRIGLTETVSDDFGLSCYNDEKFKESHVLRSQKRLAICYDSIHKIAGQYFDIVVIDEIIQVMRHVKSSSVKFKFVCLNVLRSLILNARYVVMMDADISADYLGLLRDPDLGCCKQNVDINLILNHYKPAQRQGRKIYNYIDLEDKADEEAWGINLLEYVKDKGTFIATNARTQAYNVANEVLESWGLNVTLEQGHFITEVNGRRVITITSDNSGLSEVAQFVSNINKNLRPTDVFISSPSLGTGVSVNKREGKPVFERVYCRFTKRAGNTSADCSQHIARIRGCTEFHNIIIDTLEWQETDPELIVAQEIYGRVKAVDGYVRSNDLNFDPYMNKYVFADNNWGQWFGLMVSFENLDRNEFGLNFLTRLEQEGYTIETVKSEIAPEARTKKHEQTKRVKTKQKELETQLTVDSPLLTDEEKAELDAKSQLTVDEKRQMLKRSTADAFGEYNQDGLEGLLRLSKAALKYRRSGLYFGMNSETLLLTDLSNRLDHEKMHIEKTVHYPRWSLMISLASILGITLDNDKLPHSNGAVINDGVKVAFYNRLREEKEDVKTLLGINVGYHKEMHGISTVVGNAAKAMGLKLIRKSHKGPNGEIKVRVVCQESLATLRSDILRARAYSPSPLHTTLAEPPHSLVNYVAQYNAGMPERAPREHRYLSQLNDYEFDLLHKFIKRVV